MWIQLRETRDQRCFELLILPLAKSELESEVFILRVMENVKHVIKLTEMKYA